MALLLSKDTIAVDILSFGEMSENHDILEDFISKVNIDNNSHLYEVSSNQSFIDIIMPQMRNEGADELANMDPDLRRAYEESLRTYQMVKSALE